VRALLGGTRAPGRAPEGGRELDGVCNVGVKPTVRSQGEPGAEVHLFGHGGGDLYGEPIRVRFVARIRDERRFPSLEALREQIARDAARARELLAG
jgi:riboflavin kinase/FMN adenylyltransferase